MQGKIMDSNKTDASRENRGQDSKYIYNDEPVDWPTSSKCGVRDNICTCPNCGSTAAPEYGLTCFSTKCLKCGAQMRTR